MPSTVQSSVADTVPDSTASLPTTDGSQMRHAAWLRDLEGAQHLFDADVAYFLTTASAINSQSKTVVMTAEHSRLLTTGQVELKNYSVLKPPPIADHFRGLYTSLHDSCCKLTLLDGKLTFLDVLLHVVACSLLYSSIFDSKEVCVGHWRGLFLSHSRRPATWQLLLGHGPGFPLTPDWP